MKKKLRIGLALGAGAARGCAHFGVIRALREAGLEPDVIAGTSIGALVGGVMAAGNLGRLEQAVLRMDLREIIYYFVEVSFPRSGLIDGRRVTEFIAQFVEDRRIEDLVQPFRAVATEVVTGEEVVLDRGPLIEAIRASISIPGIFTPVAKDGRVLVDGGLVNPVPVSVARAMGATYIIAVDVNHDRVGGRKRAEAAPMPSRPERKEPESDWQKSFRAAWQTQWDLLDQTLKSRVRRWMRPNDVPNIFDIIGNTVRIMEAQISTAMLRADAPDVVIQPDVGHISFMEFNRAEEAIDLGYRATIEALAKSDRPRLK